MGSESSTELIEEIVELSTELIEEIVEVTVTQDLYLCFPQSNLDP